MTVVVGTAGHIDHGKTTLLRALTGIDADRLPEERRRGMTIDVGYAHATLPGGRVLDFVDVPGHDGLVGNMLVGAGEVDAALLVVAADDGPRAQTLEHLALLDALGIRHGLAVVTKADLVDATRLTEVREGVRALLVSTTLAGAPVLAVSAEAGTGLDELRAVLAALAERVEADWRAKATQAAASRLAIDRVFTVKGRGTVVTGTLRGGPVRAGDELRLRPGDRTARVREAQVHGVPVEAGAGPGRAALNLAAVEAASLHRGMVLAAGAGMEVSDRILVALDRPATLPDTRDDAPWPPPDGIAARLHIGTAQAGARIGRTGREATDLGDGRVSALLRLDAPVAVAPGDRFVLRRPSPGAVVAGGVVLDSRPPRGVARRRVDPARVAGLAGAVEGGSVAQVLDALVALHGALARDRARDIATLLGGDRDTSGSGVLVSLPVADALAAAALRAVADHHASAPLSQGLALADLRRTVATEARRGSGLDPTTAAEVAATVLDTLVAGGRLAREGDRVRDPARPIGPPPELLAAMRRLEAALAVAAPPSLSEAARAAGCPPDGVRQLESAARIVRVESDLAWDAGTYRRLAALALEMARGGALTPAAYRDATGTSRKFVLAILEDLDRRGILRRTPEGHLPGPRAPQPGTTPAAAPSAAPPSPDVHPSAPEVP